MSRLLQCHDDSDKYVDCDWSSPFRFFEAQAWGGTSRNAKQRGGREREATATPFRRTDGLEMAKFSRIMQGMDRELERKGKEVGEGGDGSRFY
eukprot:768398-Hanusia_phi.AAC.6